MTRLPEKAETFEEAMSWANVALRGFITAIDANRMDVAEEALEVFEAYFALSADLYDKKLPQ